MAGKFYAVKIGKVPGIYSTWAACKAMVDGFPGAVYKSFKTRAEAEDFVGTQVPEPADTAAFAGTKLPEPTRARKAETEAEENRPYAFVDGSFNSATGVYGYGGFLMCDGDKHMLQGSGDDPEMTSMRNVSGEILGSMAAVELALELGLKELVIYYDYLGIEMWATGGWKRNKQGTIAYHNFMQTARQKMRITFQKVKGHSGVEGNEEADRLAKEAVGIA